MEPLKRFPSNAIQIELEESYLKSTLIDKGGRSYGLIHLPKFYVDFKDYKERNAAKDMQQEIVRLKKEGVQGLVIDLRNNGGGSLQTVVDMAGFFIDEGPVVQVKSSMEKTKVLKDRDGKTLYEGPLVILVNELSASASEILAAAMQDYERAVVLGSKQTFGKGTVQNVLELNRFISSSTYGELGALKYTTEKFYRITGKSTQLEGVKSDVVAPDQYAYMSILAKKMKTIHLFGIKSLQHPLRHGVDMKTSARPFNRVISGLKENNLFQLIDKNARWIREQQDKDDFSLNLDQFSSTIDQDEATAEEFKALDDYKNNLSFRSLEYERGKNEARHDLG